jgi:hypothetical protein
LMAICLAALSIAVPQGRVFAQDGGSSAYEYKWSVTVGNNNRGTHRTYTIYAATGSRAEELAMERWRVEYPRAQGGRVIDIERLG